MAFSDSMFLFEIIVEKLHGFVKCHEFCILCEFGDVFQLYLNNPNKLYSPQQRKKKVAKTFKASNRKLESSKKFPESKVKIGQSVLIANTSDSLITSMKSHPLEISLCSKNYPEFRLGSTVIPWSTTYIDYFNNLNNMQCDPVTVRGQYYIYDDVTFNRMAAINLKIKLSCLSDKLPRQYEIISEISTAQDNEWALGDETGVIRTIYSGGKIKSKGLRHKNINIPKAVLAKKHVDNVMNQVNENNNINIDYYIKSDTNLANNKQVSLKDSASFSSLDRGSLIKPLNYIFGDPNGRFGNKVYCVGYCSIQNDFSPSKSSKSSKSSLESMKARKTDEKTEDEKEKYKLKLCIDDCPSKYATSSHSRFSLDLPQEAAQFTTFKKCENIRCDSKFRELPTPPDDRVMMNLSSIQHECCHVTEKLEEVVGGMKAQMKIGNNPCFCSCECTFGFTKKTRYCKVCGGYELVGEDLSQNTGQLPPFPCPIFNKLDKNKLKTCSSGSDSKKRGDDSQKSIKLNSKVGDKNGESEKENKKGKKRKKDNRFKFNYGYQGIPPQIGHSQCAMPCSGTLGAVPKHMGWLWTAEDVPGMKFRPLWKPGATNKHVVRLLRMARNPDEVISKKRKKEVKKRPLKRPLLVVHKRDGEYTVTMETMKSYSRPRAPNQHPYEDKPVVTYTIGRSEEENRERRKKKERAQRRLEREQREFINSAFKNMCQEICLKTYQQALGILPDTEDPNCTCYPAEPGPDRTNINVSCSCSEDSISLGSDTDSDEWIVEFTPPNALFDPARKVKKVHTVDNGTQYTYLDYRVKLLDKYGNPVPRFFKGPNGKQECSDLGGFWSPDHTWLEINIDGIIAPDNRWAPNNFIGPNGEQVEALDGKFQAVNGKWLVLGVDGYVDCQGKWRFYPKRRASPTQKKIRVVAKKSDIKPAILPSETTWSCFGDASPKELSKMGIVGHGFDRKLLISTLKQMLDRGEDVTLPQPSVVPRRPESKRGKRARLSGINKYDIRHYYSEQTQCKHPAPSDKGVIAVDGQGNKVYFRLTDHKNKRPNERIENLNDQGISLSSFHVPCFQSFINSEIMKQQLRDRLMASAQRRNIATQV